MSSRHPFPRAVDVVKSIFSGPNFDPSARTSPLTPKRLFGACIDNRNVCVREKMVAETNDQSRQSLMNAAVLVNPSIMHFTSESCQIFSFVFNSAPYSKGAGSKWTRSHTRQRGVRFTAIIQHFAGRQLTCAAARPSTDKSALLRFVAQARCNAASRHGIVAFDICRQTPD
jgi:hypothetical protein